jgi:hypothetical protein
MDGPVIEIAEVEQDILTREFFDETLEAAAESQFRKAVVLMKTLKLLFINVLVFGLAFITLDAGYSTYRFFLADDAPNSFWLFEHPGETVRFDPQIGYSLAGTPSRVLRVTYGKTETVGYFRGNAQGFADRDDFTVKRSDDHQRRIAILGDSFSAAQSSIPLSWPDRFEDLSATGIERPVVLLNFSQWGAGLANWASILRNLIVKDGYDIDEVIFAVAWDDLDRRFALFGELDGTVNFAYTPSWEVAAQPKTVEEAHALLKNHVEPRSYVVSTAEFEAAMVGRWKPPSKWRLRVSTRVADLFSERLRAFRKTSQSNDMTAFDPNQLSLIEDMKRFIAEHSLPVTVVYIPFREELLHPESETPLEFISGARYADLRVSVDRARRFAEILGAKFIDGREAFRGLSAAEVKENWFPYDGHWNQTGSNRFADFMMTRLKASVDH